MINIKTYLTKSVDSKVSWREENTMQENAMQNYALLRIFALPIKIILIFTYFFHLYTHLTHTIFVAVFSH